MDTHVTSEQTVVILYSSHNTSSAAKKIGKPLVLEEFGVTGLGGY